MRKIGGGEMSKNSRKDNETLPLKWESAPLLFAPLFRTFLRLNLIMTLHNEREINFKWGRNERLYIKLHVRLMPPYSF